MYTHRKTLTHVSNSTQSSNTGTILQDKKGDVESEIHNTEVT